MTDTTTGGVALRTNGGLAHVTLDRPDNLNTIDLPFAKRLLEVAVAISHDPNVRAVLLNGSGRAFCGGGDLKSFAAHGKDLPQHLRDVTSHLHAALSVLARLDAPLVVAAHGAVAGAGIGLLAIGDIVIASESAKIVFAYNAIGLSPDGGVSWLLPRLIGTRRTMELALTNRALSAAEALQLGVVSRVVSDDELVTESRALAERLAAGPTRSFAATKRLVHDSWSRSYPDHLAAEGEALSHSAATADGIEGLAAFLAGRPPIFTGK